MKSHKTKDMVKSLQALGVTSAVIFDADLDENFVRATSNIPMIDVLPANAVNVYDILRRDTLILTKDALAKLEERFA